MYMYPLTAMLQAPSGMTDSQSHWLIAFTAVTAIAVLIEAIALGAMAVVVVKLISQVLKLTAELKPKIVPIIDSTRDLMTDSLPKIRDLVSDSVPKIKRVTTNVADTSDVYRAKVAEVDAFISDTAQKAKRQSDRVDTMVTGGLTSAGNVVGQIENAVMAPVRQASHLISLVKSNVERLTTRGGAAAAAVSTIVSELNRSSSTASRRAVGRTPRPVAFEGESVYTGFEDDYHA